MMRNGLTRPAVFDDDTPQVKRQRLDEEVPGNNTQTEGAPQDLTNGASSQTQPTQIINRGPPQEQTPPRNGYVQVPASSPMAAPPAFSPPPPQPNGGHYAPPPTGNFQTAMNGQYHQTMTMQGRPVPNALPKNFNFSDKPQYVGSDDDDGQPQSQQDVVPDFRRTDTPPRTYVTPQRLHQQQHQTVWNSRTYVPQQPGINMVLNSPNKGSPAGGAMPNFGKFAYMPSGHTNSVPQGRLDSLKSQGSPPAFNPMYATPPHPGMGGPGALSYQPHPGVMHLGDNPSLDIDLSRIPSPDYRNKVARLKTVFPNVSTGRLFIELTQKQGNYDLTVQSMAQYSMPVPMGFSPGPQYSPMPQMSQMRPIIQHTFTPQPAKTSRKEARVPRRTIRDKYFDNTEVYSDRSSPATERRSPRPQRKRLVRAAAAKRSSTPDSAASLGGSDVSDESDSEEEDSGPKYEYALLAKVLHFLNTCHARDLIDTTACKEEVADLIISKRPYASLDDVRVVTVEPPANAKGGRRGPRRPVGDKVVDDCLETWRGYEAVDMLIAKCEDIGRPIAESIKQWGVDIFGAANESGELEMVEINKPNKHDSAVGTPSESSETTNVGDFISTQPKNLAEKVELKDYQLVGINWLNLLYNRQLSCILADEMGLGKTFQVIAFMAHLLQHGAKGPHLVVVPASTLENWMREFQKFCPDLKVKPYYGSQKERQTIRQDLLKEPDFNVLVTTYNLANGDKYDKQFLKNQQFDICVYDEGHMLKNSASSRYIGLMGLPAKFRLLLTGTPLQNNLQELASLLSFILPQVFVEKKEDLAAIFKHKAKTSDEQDAQNSVLLSAQRVKRAKAMMTPFVLRRKKDQVLKHLPTKTLRVEYSEMSEAQKAIYDEQIQAAKDSIEARAAGKKATKNSSNLMMQLRKAAIHPWLFRKYFDDKTIKKMSHDIMKEPRYVDNDEKYILEDMEPMNDFELNRLCKNFPDTLSKYRLKNEEHMDAGKVAVLKRLLIEMKKNGDRVLLFSQFTQVLDILEEVLTTLDMTFIRIDGQTPVETRQDLIDQYHEEEDITVFLLSTKAGGFGINLACANKVIIFDSSFNPHDDRQAADRAHRVGQKRPVEVITLVSKDTIEEQILALAKTKLALDQSLSEDAPAAGAGEALEKKGEELVAKMLLGKPADE